MLCLLRTAVKTVLTETFLRIFARRMAKRCLSSGGLGRGGRTSVRGSRGDDGRLLISFAPAGKMEAFFNEREKLGIKPGAYATGADAALLHAFGMELIGPPLVVE